MKLEGKKALVTGGGTGFGRASALLFAKEGADVAVCGRTAKNIEAVRDEIIAMGRKSIAIPTDVSVKAQVDSMAEKVLAEFGRLDILMNNAGIYPDGGEYNIVDVTEEMYDHILNVNLKSVFLVTKAFLKHMMDNKYGKIVNVSSLSAAGCVTEGESAYAASKYGVVGFTKACAREAGPYGINVNSIAPGLIMTPMSTANKTPEQVEGLVEFGKNNCVLGRVGVPEDIANLALFLVSDDSNYITAEFISSDGGKTCLMRR